jgi:hypothetical protein
MFNFFVSVMLLGVSVFAFAAGPKYGPTAKRLYDSHRHIQSQKAPDFWALMPYYVHQQNGSSCSIASVTMVVNAARASQTLKSDDELFTQKSLLSKLNDSIWSSGVGDKGHGVSLDELGRLTLLAIRAAGFDQASVEVVHIDPEDKKLKDRLHKLLIANEKSDRDFLIANFLQSEFTGDPEGAVGHISPIGSYDVQQKKVLILDPDRQYYEPYWVSEETFFKGMATKDVSATKYRGYVYVKL